MILVEQHQYSINSEHYKELNHLCFLSKNLYNVSLYHVRQYYFHTHKYLGFNTLNKLSNELFPDDYKALPAKVSQQVQRLVDQNFKSFFSHIKSKNANEKVNIPRYLDKVNGRQVVQYTKQAISFNNRNVPDGYLRLSGVSFIIKTNVTNVQFARIVPHNNYITIEIGYEVKEREHIQNDRYASIDIGVDNLCAITSNCFSPVLVNGKPLKSINQYYNKIISKRQSKSNQKYTKRMYAITRKRNNKINDYMHKASCYVVNLLVSNNISTLIIGHNKLWEQDTTMNKKSKQTFIQIPFNNFISMLTYKCNLQGIEVILQEESYTSKSSFVNQDYIATFGVDDDKNSPTGSRVKRGLFKNNTSDNKLKFLNADVNGSYNILRKYLTTKEVWNEKIYSNCIEVCSTPSVYTVKF